MTQPKSVYRMLVKNSEYSYDAKKVTRLIVLIKRIPDERLKDKYKQDLFIHLSKLITKAINNFFNLIKDINQEKIIHTKEDICSECFIIMNKCVTNCEISELKKFYFYINTSLNRGIYRVYEKNYKKHFDVLDNSDKTEALILSKKYTHHFDNSAIDLKNFTKAEMDLIEFKLSGQKLSTFLKTKNISSSQYYLVFDSVVKKLKDLYKDDEDLKRFLK
jgi:hypothetical protein